MSKSADPSGAGAGAERRGSRRVEVQQSARIEPADASDGTFSEVTPALDVARSGLAFASKRKEYYLGMKLRVTYPYSVAMQKHYTGKIVRIQRLDENFQRISVQLEEEA